ncbi:MAG: hypothetical protein ACKV2V_24875 [Blastocatellia bacterium]
MYLLFLLTAGDAEVVWRPVLFFTLLAMVTAVIFLALSGGIALFARWKWVLAPVAGYHVHPLGAVESATVLRAGQQAVDEEEKLRYEAVLLSGAGYSPGQIARRFDREKDEVESWLRMFDEAGLAALH